MEPIQEIAYGIIPLFKQDGFWQVFLIKHAKGEYWGFPKGHVDNNDTCPEETAERELQEETGLKVIESFDIAPLFEKFQFMRNKKLIEKSVYYFLASVTHEYRLEKKEILDGKWLNVNSVIKYMSFDEGKTLIQKLIGILDKI